MVDPGEMTPTGKGVHLKQKKAEQLAERLEQAAAAVDAALTRANAATGSPGTPSLSGTSRGTGGTPGTQDPKDIIRMLQASTSSPGGSEATLSSISEAEAATLVQQQQEQQQQLARQQQQLEQQQQQFAQQQYMQQLAQQQYMQQLAQQQYMQQLAPQMWVQQASMPAATTMTTSQQQASLSPLSSMTHEEAGGEQGVLDPAAQSFTPQSHDEPGDRRPPQFATGANALPLGRRAGDACDDGTRALHEEIDRLRAQLDQQRFGTPFGLSGKGTHHSPKVYPPDKYEGEADKLHSFLDDLEQWFAHYPTLRDAERVTYSSTLLAGAAKAWYDQRRREAKARGVPVFDTLADLQAALRAHFLDAGRWARSRAKLVRLRQTSDIHEYNKEFTLLLTDIPDISSSEKCFYYVSGLRREIRRQIRLVPEWVQLNEHPRRATEETYIALKTKANEMSDDTDAVRPSWTQSESAFVTRKRKADAVNNLRAIIAKHSPEKRRKLRAERRCYICESKDHLARDCPTAEGRSWKASVSHLYAGWDEEDLNYIFTLQAPTDDEPPQDDAVNYMNTDVQAEDFEESDSDDDKDN